MPLVERARAGADAHAGRIRRAAAELLPIHFIQSGLSYLPDCWFHCGIVAPRSPWFSVFVAALSWLLFAVGAGPASINFWAIICCVDLHEPRVHVAAEVAPAAYRSAHRPNSFNSLAIAAVTGPTASSTAAIRVRYT
jgi:hypothetical protein